ncbi:CDP-6-deoxy-delta-3,4-glucoseen reductase [Ferrovum sp. PN-J185]|uniref:CDP-6-deoxy-delta-3,4-glucoseen reductase n=1 Tax=Ferrovum sp. PN-J185 TaxID=1356306 RepID=UPI0007949C80|nr:CDP-6-deoxy-delta-3,4-glucoseen reductase [Ferrovum sp. PN-J185]KXW55948.1 CDP-6-deoxy-L-threo-D-glycero-4-hexulose-3-dehydrase reductase [Ferrovum sp. PN-J185]MCC6068664.1 CDP-6-deoxy-delta-3,4-glucoseen reductase [Ferrovum sp. PN-J185]MDE1891933.1 CDP-6-deoxy-delta-3,4-glucoseen reductase [Betaproteobacteria bacterium]MDE2056927.1 CDP-6-deoxy-delta-3,4-glucoseen reductase [Betaproteobacteria bacterium]
MSVKVTLSPSGNQFQCDSEDTILEGAQKEGFILPFGCRSGACGSCKGKVIDGSVDRGEYQSSALTDEEVGEGYALLCCAKPITDITVEIRQVNGLKDIQVKKLPCRVESIEKPNHDVAILKLKLPAQEKFEFLAGQYIDFLLKDGKKRSFSMANAPHETGMIELHIRNYPGGSFSQYVFNELKEKTILRFEGPLGTFFLREDSDKPIIFMAGATGFAPIKGIIESARHKGIDRPMVLYWGVRTKADLYYYDLAQSWVNDRFTFIPVLSEPLLEDQWQGRTGLVHEAILADYADLSGYQVYACGAPIMVESGFKAFTQTRALPEDEFYSDPFTPSVDNKATS